MISTLYIIGIVLSVCAVCWNLVTRHYVLYRTVTTRDIPVRPEMELNLEKTLFAMEDKLHAQRELVARQSAWIEYVCKEMGLTLPSLVVEKPSPVKPVLVEPSLVEPAMDASELEWIQYGEARAVRDFEKELV